VTATAAGLRFDILLPYYCDVTQMQDAAGALVGFALGSVPGPADWT
jgi:hypothetical protein